MRRAERITIAPVNAASTLMLSAAVLVAGCASVDTRDEPREEREYTTGSRLPKKTYPQPAGVRVYVPDPASDAPWRPVPGPAKTGG